MSHKDTLFSKYFGMNAKRLMLLTFCSIALPCVALTGAYQPPDGEKILIVGQDTISIDAYNDSIGITPGGVTTYINLSDLSGLITQVDNGGGPNNAGYLQANYPNSVHAMAVYLVNQLDGVNSGFYDGEMDELIRILASWERPIFLRWGYEADGAWNGYDPEAYRLAFRRMANKVKAAGATNIVMVWQVASYCGGSLGGRSFQDWYPGDEYVDWLGMSYFTPQDCNNTAVDSFIDFARTKQKPVLIAESASQRYDLEQGTYNASAQRTLADQNKTGEQIWNEWFANYFNFIERNDDLIKAVAYINADWDSQALWKAPYPEGYWGDTRVQTNNYIRDLWVAEINGEGWLNASAGLFELLKNGEGVGSSSSSIDSSSSSADADSSSSIGSSTSSSARQSSSASSGGVSLGSADKLLPWLLFVAVLRGGAIRRTRLLQLAKGRA